MKMLKKLALVSAVSMISAGAFAMEALDEASMAETTGQDGITIKIKPPATLGNWTTQANGSAYDATNPNPFGVNATAGVLSIDAVYIHDKDGFAPGGTKVTAGAISLTNMKIAGSAPIQLDIDADGGALGADPTLNIKVTLPGVFIVRTGDIGVAGSKRDGKTSGDYTTADRGIVAASNKVIIKSFDVSLGGTIMNIQLAKEVQGAMIKVDGTIVKGLQITGLQLDDTSGAAATALTYSTTGGSVYIDRISVTDTASNNLTLATDIDLGTEGLNMTMRAGSAKTDILMNGIRLGATGTASANTSIGDVEIVGMNMAGTVISIAGH